MSILTEVKDKSFDIKALFKFIKIIKQEKPDIVHTHASSVARMAARFVKGTKVIYTRHCAYPVSGRIKKGIYEDLIESLSGRKAIAMREKSATEAIIVASALAAQLEEDNKTLSEYLEEIFNECRIIAKWSIVPRYSLFS